MKHKGWCVFSRTWWTPNPAYPNGLEPSAGKRHFLACFKTEEEARAVAGRRNANLQPTARQKRLSFKYEYSFFGRGQR